MNFNCIIFANFYLLHSGGEQIIVFAMLLFFGIAIYFLAAEISRFAKHEVKQLKQAKANYQHTDKKNNSPSENHRLLIDKCEKSIVYNRLKNIYFATYQGHLIFQKDLTKNDRLKEAAKPISLLIKNIRHIIFLLMGLGISYEMMQMLSEFYLQYENGTKVFLNKTNLAYLQAIFSLSFFSLLLVSILSIAILVLKNYKQAFFTQLEQFTSHYLLPLLNPLKEEQQLGLLIAEVSENTKRMNLMSENLEYTTKLISEDYQILRQTTENLKVSLAAFVTAQQTLHTDIAALTKIVEGYKNQNDSKRGQNERMVEALNLHNLTIEKINGQLLKSELNTGDWIQQIVELSHEQQNDFQQNLKTMLELSRSSLSSTQSASHRFNMSIGKFEKSLVLLHNHLESFSKKGSQNIDKQLVKFGEFNSYLTDLNHTMAQLQDDLPKQLERILEYLKHGNNAITEQRIKKIAASMVEQKTAKQLITYKEKQIFLEDEITRLRQELEGKWWPRFLKK